MGYFGSNLDTVSHVIDGLKYGVCSDPPVFFRFQDDFLIAFESHLRKGVRDSFELHSVAKQISLDSWTLKAKLGGSRVTKSNRRQVTRKVSDPICCTYDILVEWEILDLLDKGYESAQKTRTSS